MPRFVASTAPKCARCNTSVYLAEQVIGPASRPYHRTCLTCVVCNKRLDSTLLVEHDGEPYCKNCHREHLGTGKGGFSKAVALNPTSPRSPRSPVTSLPSVTRSPTTPSTIARQQYNTPETTLQRGLRELVNRSPSPTKIHLDAPTTPVQRGLRELANRSPSPTKPASEESYQQGHDLVTRINIRARSSHPNPLAPSSSTSSNKDSSVTQTAVRSTDEAMASDTIGLSDPVARLQAAVGDMSINAHSIIPSTTSSVDKFSDVPTSSRYAATPPSSAQKLQYSTETSIAEDGTPFTIHTRRVAASENIGTIDLNGFSGTHSASAAPVTGQLPPARRPDPRTLTGASGTVKIASPRAVSQQSAPSDATEKRRSGIDRIGLTSSIADASGGTPLCARCLRPVYFAEQKAAAGRKWHRACLRCDACSTTLESGKMEEGPVSLASSSAPRDGANIWCRICYAKYFGPKNLVVGLSLPETMSR